MIHFAPRTLLHKEISQNPSLRSLWEKQLAVTLRGIAEELWRIQGATQDLVARALAEGHKEHRENVESFADIMTLVQWYYRLVDVGDFERMYQLFSHDIFYKRGGDMIVGLEQLREFYEQKRKVNITHRLFVQHPIQRGELMDVFVWGEYTGTKNGQPTQGSFVDILGFNSLLQIRTRRTCLQRDMRPSESYQIIQPLFQAEDVQVFDAAIIENGETQGAIIINQGHKEWIYLDGQGGETVR